jgi:hypothetical protein
MPRGFISAAVRAIERSVGEPRPPRSGVARGQDDDTPMLG